MLGSSDSFIKQTKPEPDTTLLLGKRSFNENSLSLYFLKNFVSLLWNSFLLMGQKRHGLKNIQVKKVNSFFLRSA